MSDTRFWSIVDASAANEADPDRQKIALYTALRALTPDEIEAFDAAFAGQIQRSYTWDLWGAAYVIHGGASDDGFEYFCRWLISKGHRVFEAVLADPDKLADLLAPDSEGALEFEDYAYVAMDAWAAKTGRPAREMPRQTGGAPAGEPTGVPFKEDSTSLAARFPKLSRRFGDHPLG